MDEKLQSSRIVEILVSGFRLLVLPCPSSDDLERVLSFLDVIEQGQTERKLLTYCLPKLGG